MWIRLDHIQLLPKISHHPASFPLASKSWWAAHKLLRVLKTFNNPQKKSIRFQNQYLRLFALQVIPSQLHLDSIFSCLAQKSKIRSSSLTKKLCSHQAPLPTRQLQSLWQQTSSRPWCPRSRSNGSDASAVTSNFCTHSRSRGASTAAELKRVQV